jgi:hypothetical protein
MLIGSFVEFAVKRKGAYEYANLSGANCASRSGERSRRFLLVAIGYGTEQLIAEQRQRWHCHRESTDSLKR